MKGARLNCLELVAGDGGRGLVAQPDDLLSHLPQTSGISLSPFNNQSTFECRLSDISRHSGGRGGFGGREGGALAISRDFSARSDSSSACAAEARGKFAGIDQRGSPCETACIPPARCRAHLVARRERVDVGELQLPGLGDARSVQ